MDVEFHIDDLGVVVELDIVRFQILDHGEDHGLILVVLRESQGLEIRQTAHMVDEAFDVEFHLQGAVPVLEGEHSAPVEPEVGVQYLVVKEIRDALVIKLLVGGEEQLHDLHGRLVGQGKLPVGVGILAPIDSGTAEGVVGVLFVQPVVFVQNTDALRLNGRNGVEQIPHDLKMVVHLAATAHDISHTGILPAVAGSTGDGVFLKEMDVLTFHLTIPHQIAGCGQGRQPGADNIGRLLVNALRLQRTCKCFISAACIIHIVRLLVFCLCLYCSRKLLHMIWAKAAPMPVF